MLAAVILANGFTLTPSDKELFVGSLVTGIVVVSVAGLITGATYLILECWRQKRQQQRDASLASNGTIHEIPLNRQGDSDVGSFEEDDLEL